MDQFLVFAAGYALIIAATANASYVCFRMGYSCGIRNADQPTTRKVLTSDDGSL
jgi:hypothetical protein